jgi:hypothetical protein
MSSGLTLNPPARLRIIRDGDPPEGETASQFTQEGSTSLRSPTH